MLVIFSSIFLEQLSPGAIQRWSKKCGSFRLYIQNLKCPSYFDHSLHCQRLFFWIWMTNCTFGSLCSLKPCVPLDPLRAKLCQVPSLVAVQKFRKALSLLLAVSGWWHVYSASSCLKEHRLEPFWSSLAKHVFPAVPSFALNRLYLQISTVQSLSHYNDVWIIHSIYSMHCAGTASATCKHTFLSPSLGVHAAFALDPSWHRSIQGQWEQEKVAWNLQHGSHYILYQLLCM